MIKGLEELLLASAQVEGFLVNKGWRFCFIGGVAVQRWGNPRFTQDIDLTLLTGFGDEENFLNALLQELMPRRSDAREFALANRVLLAQTKGGIEVDIALGGLPFEERTISRASAWKVREGVTLTTCSAEDLVVHKTFAGRDLDWGDVERILIREHKKLDLDQIRSELMPLLELKNEPEAMRKLEGMISKVNQRLEAKK